MTTTIEILEREIRKITTTIEILEREVRKMTTTTEILENKIKLLEEENLRLRKLLDDSETEKTMDDRKKVKEVIEEIFSQRKYDLERAEGLQESLLFDFVEHVMKVSDNFDIPDLNDICDSLHDLNIIAEHILTLKEDWSIFPEK